MRKWYTTAFSIQLLFFCLLNFNLLHAQSGRMIDLFEPVQSKASSLDTVITAYDLIRPREAALSQISTEQPERFSFAVEVQGKKLLVELHRVNLFSPNAVFYNSRGTVSYMPQLHYQGSVNGIAKSVAALSFGNGQVSGVLSDEAGNINISSIDPVNPSQTLHIIYREKEVRKKPVWDCFTPDMSDLPKNPALQTEQPRSEGSPIGCAVDMYFEADHSMFQYWKTTAATINYVAAAFNVVKKIYENEDINIQLRSVKVWDVTDPYANATTTQAALNLFSSQMDAGFKGDLAHLLSQRSLGGGRAWINILCNSNYYRTGVSEISPVFSQFPTYSWTAMVLTHEVGHNLGSPHTHSCTWPGGPIDNCATQEGACAAGPNPINGGTIMSYCHTTSHGINFSNGFGPLPGNLIRSRVVASGTCLCECEQMTLTVNVTDAVCSQLGAAEAVVSGGTAPYTYRWSTGGTGKIVTGLKKGTYQVEVTDNGGNCTVTQTFTIDAVGLDKATVSPAGIVMECGNSRLLEADQNGVGFIYQWYKDGLAIAGATGSSYIATTDGAYTVKIKAGTCERISAPTRLTIAHTAVPAITASGALTFCSGGSVTFTTPHQAGNTFQWYRNGTDAIANATGTTLTVNETGSYTVRNSAKGCTQTSQPQQVTVLPRPNVKVQPNVATHIKSRELTLTASGAQEYDFEQQPHRVSFNNSTLVVNPPQSTRYVITGTADNGCTNKDSAEITVVGCGDATSLQSEVYSPARVRVQWTNPPGVTQDTLEYKPVNETTWTKMLVEGNEALLTNLKPNIEYEFRVTTLCTTTDRFFYSDTGHFITPELTGTHYLRVLPNPVSQDSYLEIVLPQAATVSVVLYTYHGQQLGVLLPQARLNEGHLFRKLNLPEGLAQGVYMLAVYIDGKPTTVKLVKMR